jgi:hypothetical protein
MVEILNEAIELRRSRETGDREQAARQIRNLRRAGAGRLLASNSIETLTTKQLRPYGPLARSTSSVQSRSRIFARFASYSSGVISPRSRRSDNSARAVDASALLDAPRSRLAVKRL